MPIHKYRPYEPVALPDRRWPNRTIDHAPVWCSVDLRDGNQALIEPMGQARKWRMFEMLVRLGFKEIEIGFPSASQPDFDFVRSLIERRAIPPDVTIQVITQGRPELIERTFEAIAGAPRVIVHLYTSTSTLQRRVVFGLERSGIIALTTAAVSHIKRLAARLPASDVRLQYSPESFTGTELDFAHEICEAVIETWDPSPQRKMILNLPSTVEMSTPNVFADRVEWFDRTLARRDSVVLSVHPHNDRGTAVATAELSVLAGADRLEGTLFGNGERTGNVDLVTLALNLFSHGIDPKLDLRDVPEILRTVEYCNRLPVPARHPYGGELVFTAFSGSHQDAIKKGFAARAERGDVVWEVPYLPIDPLDIGRSYEAVVRINSQSGKGGVAYVMLHDFGYDLPRWLQVEFAKMVQGLSEADEVEIEPREIIAAFEREYVNPIGPWEFRDARVERDGNEVTVMATLSCGKRVRTLSARGNDPAHAFASALGAEFGIEFALGAAHEHALGSAESTLAVVYAEVVFENVGYYGVGRDPQSDGATFRAILAAAHRALRAVEDKRVAVAV